MPDLTHVFFDVGGVLGSNGWDREQRAKAREHFGIEDDNEETHYAVVEKWEAGFMTLDEYLDRVWFDRPRDVSREAFVTHMKAQSEPRPDALALARRLRDEAPQVRRMTLNNESEVLNVHRLRHFGLHEVMEAFLSSCWLGVMKPDPAMFTRTLGITDADPTRSLFLDDREENVEAAREAGFHAVQVTETADIEEALIRFGLLGG